MAYIYMPFHNVENVRGIKWQPQHYVIDKQGGESAVPTEGQIWPRGSKAAG